MDLLLLIIGNKDKIIRAAGLNPDEIEVIKIDEKDISRPRFIIKNIKQKKYINVYFGTIENELQRFQIFIKLWMLLAGAFHGGIIDELGSRNKFNIFKLFFIELPLLFIEAIASFFIIIYFYIKLPILKWKLKRN